MSLSTIVVGAYGRHSMTGAAYVYTKANGQWRQSAILRASDGVPRDYFGQSVAISGSTVVIGAWGHKRPAGAAYVFTGSGKTWSQTVELHPSNPAAYDAGISVGVSGPVIVVGAFGQNNATGAAYVFAQSGGTWTQSAELTPSDGAPDDFFGEAVAVSGTAIVVGAHQHASVTGAAYVYTESGAAWPQTSELVASDGAPGDQFGVSVALSGNTAVIGAQGHDSGAGAAYVFRV